MIVAELIVHMLWVTGSLSKIEKISVNSFVSKGYRTLLWSYGGLDNAPPGAEVRDAREVLPENRLFRGKSGSLAQFSDLFRYAVLNSQGGLWADADVVALSAPSALGAVPFLVTERDQASLLKKMAKKALRRPDGRIVSNNVIYNPVPAAGNIVDLAFGYASSFPKEKIVWGELGPRLISAIESIYPDHGFKVHPPGFANPVDWWRCPQDLLKSPAESVAGASFLHLYNETWRRAGVDKNANFPRNSLMHDLADEFLY